MAMLVTVGIRSARIFSVHTPSVSVKLVLTNFLSLNIFKVNITIESDTEVVVLVPSYFQNLSSILNSTLSEPEGKT